MSQKQAPASRKNNEQGTGRGKRAAERLRFALPPLPFSFKKDMK